MVPSGLIAAVPCAGALIAITDSWLVSMSVSLASTSMVTEPSSLALPESSLATGASSTGATVTVTVAVAWSVPSETV